MKAQVWQTEFIFAIIIVVTSFILFFSFLPSNETSYSVDYEITIVPQLLLTQGYPLNWTPATVEQIGIISQNNRINETKIEYLYDMPSSDISQYLGITSSFYMQLNQSGLVTINGRNYIGTLPEESSDIYAAKRFVIYQGEIAQLDVWLWN